MSDETIDTTDTEWVDIDSITEDPANARQHPKRNMEAIKGSLRRFGQTKPIVVGRSDRVVIAGSGTLRGLREIDATKVLVRWSDLEGAERMAYAIADNRTGELAEWDFPVLSEQMKALQEAEFPLPDIGWEDYETFPLVAAEWNANQKGDKGKSKVNAGEKNELATIQLTASEYADLEQIIGAVRATTEGADAWSEGRILTQICRSYADEKGLLRLTDQRETKG